MNPCLIGICKILLYVYLKKLKKGKMWDKTPYNLQIIFLYLQMFANILFIQPANSLKYVFPKNLFEDKSNKSICIYSRTPLFIRLSQNKTFLKKKILISLKQETRSHSFKIKIYFFLLLIKFSKRPLIYWQTSKLLLVCFCYDLRELFEIRCSMILYLA